MRSNVTYKYQATVVSSGVRYESTIYDVIDGDKPSIKDAIESIKRRAETEGFPVRDVKILGTKLGWNGKVGKQ